MKLCLVVGGGSGAEQPNATPFAWTERRAPLAKLQAYKQRMGWTFPWSSSLGGDFNFDFNVWFTEVQQREGSVEYNYQREAATRWTRRRSRSPSPS